MTKQKLSAVAGIAFAAALVAGVATARKEAPVPDKELRAVVDQFAAGWNQGDAKMIAAQFAADGT